MEQEGDTRGRREEGSASSAISHTDVHGPRRGSARCSDAHNGRDVHLPQEPIIRYGRRSAIRAAAISRTHRVRASGRTPSFPNRFRPPASPPVDILLLVLATLAPEERYGVASSRLGQTSSSSSRNVWTFGWWRIVSVISVRRPNRFTSEYTLGFFFLFSNLRSRFH